MTIEAPRQTLIDVGRRLVLTANVHPATATLLWTVSDIADLSSAVVPVLLDCVCVCVCVRAPFMRNWPFGYPLFRGSFLFLALSSDVTCLVTREPE